MVSVFFALRVVPGLEPGSDARRARCLATQHQLSAQFVFDVFFAKSFLFEANQPPAVMPTSKCGNCKAALMLKYVRSIKEWDINKNLQKDSIQSNIK